MSDDTFAGSISYAHWIYPGGTIVLTGNQRSMTFTRNKNYIDASAGNDKWQKQLVGMRSIAFSLSGITPQGGTVLEQALDIDVPGTLVCGPEGTASGKRKWTVPAFSNGPTFNMPYQGVVEFTNEFVSEGAPTLDGVW